MKEVDIVMTALIAGSILVGVMVVVGLPVWLGIRYALRDREMQHMERMKALEMGRPLPGEVAAAEGSPRTKQVVSIGLGVPATAFGIAFVATMVGMAGNPAPWVAAGVVGAMGVLCGTILALRLPPDSDSAGLHGGLYPAKPSIDPDAFDVVSQRG